MTHKRTNIQLACLIACASCMFQVTDTFAGGPYGGDRFLPQRRFHGYYPTIWRPWASGWQAPIHKEHLPTIKQTPMVAPPRPTVAPEDDAAPAPPATEPLPLEPLTPTVPDTDTPPDLPTPPGLEGTLPEPGTPGQEPMPPGLEETMPEPSTPDQPPADPMGEPVPDTPSLDEPFEMPLEPSLDPPAESAEPGLIPPDLESMPDPSLPPGFEMPEMEEDKAPEAPPEGTPAEGAPTEAEPPAKSSRVPSSGWTGRGAGSSEPRRMPAYNRLREPSPAVPVNGSFSSRNEPRRLNTAMPEAQPLPQRLPVPDTSRPEPAAVQVRFNAPATNRVDARSPSPTTSIETTKWHNPLRSGQRPARPVVREDNPLR